MPRTVLHFLNQFFAGIGGEAKADVGVTVHDGPVGPGRRLQVLLGEGARLAVTVSCGDDFFAGHCEEVLEEIGELARRHAVDLAVAGPAFASGRYGVACVEVGHVLSARMGMPCVTALHERNPATAVYRRYGDPGVFAVPTAEQASGMEDALSRIARLVQRLAAGEPLGCARDAGYLPRGLRVVEVAARTGADRAVDMLLDKLAGRPFVTEIPVDEIEQVTIAPPIASDRALRLGLVTTAGVFGAGNPDGFKAFGNTQWKKYAVAGLGSMSDRPWEVLHGGYNNGFMAANANYGVPLDACRELERQGVIADLHGEFYATSGVNALISVMETLGREIAADMKAQGIGAALLVST